MVDFRRTVLALLTAVAATAAFAQEQPGRPAGERGHAEPGRQEQDGPGVLSLLPGDAVTEHSIDTRARASLTYTATAGTLSLFDQSGERSAAIFYTAYVAKTERRASRPLTFVFNGGPGAASAFLNLGLVGPRIAEFGMAGRDGAKPPRGQSGHLARLHRSRADRSGRHRLEPGGQARRRQGLLGRATAMPNRWPR